MVYRQTNNENSYQYRNNTEIGYLSNGKYPTQNMNYIGKFIAIRYKSEYRRELNQRFHIQEGWYDDYTYPGNSGIRNVFFRILRWDTVDPGRAILMSDLGEIIVTYVSQLENDLYDLTDSHMLKNAEIRLNEKGYEYLILNETDDPDLFFDKLYYEKVNVYPVQNEFFLWKTVWTEYDKDIHKLKREKDVLQYKNKNAYKLTQEQRNMMLARNSKLYGLDDNRYESYPSYYNLHRKGKINESRRAINKGYIIRADLDDFVDGEFVVMEVMPDRSVRFVTQHEANFYYIIEDLEDESIDTIIPEELPTLMAEFLNNINAGFNQDEEQEGEDTPSGGEEQEGEDTPSGGGGEDEPVDSYKLLITDSDNNIIYPIKSNALEIYNIIYSDDYIISNNEDVEIADNVVINIATDRKTSFTLNNINIDNSSRLEDRSTILFTGIGEVTFNYTGENIIKGFKASSDMAATAIIYQNNKKGSMNINSFDGFLEIIDINSEDTDFGLNNPTAGIYSRGNLTINNGELHINTNGECLMSQYGVVDIIDGYYDLNSYQAASIRSKQNDIFIEEGTVAITSLDDGIRAKFGTVHIFGGETSITSVGDGINGENVDITGGFINIITNYRYSGVNFYIPNSIGGNSYNTFKDDGNMKTDNIRYDTGSHKGIKVGTKGKRFIYTTVSEDSEYEANKIYEQAASGQLSISGGNITINTLQTGIKYFDGNNKMIIGSPDDGIHCNGSAIITGGNILITSGDDGICCDGTIRILSGSVTINNSFEGIEGRNIIIGSSETGNGPSIAIYSNNDCINTLGKSYSFVYADESESVFTKTTVASEDGSNLYIYGGNVVLNINDTGLHYITLRTANGTKVYTYESNGDGIDCNGSLYIHGGSLYVYGKSGNTANTPIDFVSNFVIGENAIIFATGCNIYGDCKPTETRQPYLTNDTKTSIITPGEFRIVGLGINSFNNTLPEKANNSSFFLFTSPLLNMNSSYYVYSDNIPLGSFESKM